MALVHVDKGQSCRFRKMRPSTDDDGQDNTLVILLAAKGQKEFENAYDVFDDLFAKVSPGVVIAAQLKPESGNSAEVEIPHGLQKLAEEHNVGTLRGCLIKAISNEDGFNNHWPTYYPEVLSSIGLGKTDLNLLHFHVSAGSFPVSSAILNLSRILDCSSWVTLEDRDQGKWLASEITPPDITSAQASTFAKCAEDAIASGGPRPFSPSELQSIAGTPKSKGVSRSMSEVISKGLIEKISEKSYSGEVQYLPTEDALLEGIFSLSSKTSETLPKSPQTGIMITARASWSKDQFISFLQEHGFPLQASKIALIVCDFADNPDLIQKGAEFAEAVNALTGRSLVEGVRTCDQLIPVHGETDLSSCSFRILSQMHSIIRGNDGLMIDWSIISTGIPAILRHHFQRYAQTVGLTILDPIRGLSSGSGTRGAKFDLSGKDIVTHRIEVPSIGEIRKLQRIWCDDRMHVSESLATCLMYSDHSDGSPLPRDRLRELNHTFFEPGEWQYSDHNNPKDVARKSIERLQELGAITDRKDAFELTDVGEAGARLVRIRKEAL